MRFAFTCITLLVCIHSISQETYLVINPDGHRGSIYSSVLDKKQNLITGSFDKTVKVWNLKNAYVVKEFYGEIGPGSEGMIYALDISPDNKYLAVGGWFGKDDESEDLGDIRIYDYETGQIKRRLKLHANVIRSLRFTPDSKYLISGDADGYIGVWDYISGTPLQIRSTKSWDLSSIAVSDDYFISCHPDGMVYQWDYTSEKPLKKFDFFTKVKDLSVKSEVLIAENGETIILTGQEIGMVCVLDRKMKLLSYFFTPNSTEVVEIALSPNEERIACSLKDPGNNRVIVYEKNDEKWNQIASYKNHDDIILTVHFLTDDMLVSTGGSKNEIATWQITENEKTKEIKRFAGVGSAIYAASLDSNLLAFTRIPEKAYGFAPCTEAFDLFNRQKIPVRNVTAIYQPVIEKNGIRLFEKRLARKSENDPYEILYISKNDKLIDSVPRYPWDGNRHDTYTFVSNDLFVSGGSYGILEVFNLKGEKLSRLVGHDGDIRSLTISGNSKFLVSASTDMTIRLWPMILLGKEEFIYPTASIFIAENNEWVIWNQEGYFTSSKRGANYVGYHINQGKSKAAKYYPFDQFDVQYNRPDIILKELAIADQETIDLYEQAYKKRIKRLGFDDTKFSEEKSAPLMTIKSSEQKDHQVTITFDAKDEKFELDRIQVYQNDVPIYGRKGISLSEKNTKFHTGTITLDLLDGENKIQLAVMNKNGVESLRETIFITESGVTSGDLYVVAVGVSDYQDKNFKLDYAAKDAEDLINVFEGNTRYETIHHKLLVNNQVTRENLLNLSEFFSQTKSNDVVILFIAGHGVLNSNLDYYYGTFDMNFQQPESRGISYKELESLFDGIKAIRKLLIMDTCHSGELDKEDVESTETTAETNSEISFRTSNAAVVTRERQGLKKTNEAMKEMFNDLNRGTGTTVISAAAGVEFAMESTTWKNGLFTYCLLSGLKENLADLNGDQIIYLSELQTYIRLRVSELSQGKQNPGSRFENITLDYAIW